MHSILLLDTIVYYTFLAFGSVVIICEMGQRLSNAFDEIGELMWQLEWYLYSNEIQKMLPTILVAVRKPIAIEFFGSLSCSREFMKKVISFIQIQYPCTHPTFNLIMFECYHL